MPPRTDLELIEWDLPALGMNSDASAVNIPAQQAALVNNYITGEPGQMRLRQGMKTAAWIARSNHTATGGRGEVGGTPLSQTYYTSSTTDFDSDKLVCLGVAVYGDQALITFGNYGNSVAFRGDWLHGYPSNYPGTTQAINVRTYVMRAPLGVINTTLYEPMGTGTATEEQKMWFQGSQTDAGGYVPLGPPFPAVSGHGVPFDEKVYFVCPTTYGMFGHKLIHAWAGAGGVDVSTGTAPPNTNGLLNSVSLKINNGSRDYDVTNETSSVQLMVNKYNALVLPKINGAGGINGTGGTNKEAYYIYKIAQTGSGIFSAGAGLFTQEYGRGALSSVVPNEAPATSATRNFHVWPVAPVRNGPAGANTVNAFQGRLFAFGGTKCQGRWMGDNTTTGNGYVAGALYPNLVQWSTGIGEEWPEENFFFIDDASNDVIMAAGTVNELQLICTRTQMYVHSGYDEDSFQLDSLSRHDGCLDHRSMRNIEGRLYWVGADGLWSWSGSGLPVRESHPRSGVGIRSDILLQRNKQTAYQPYSHHVSLGRVRDRVVWTTQDGFPSTAIAAPYVYHPASGSFARMQMDTYYHYVNAPSTTQRQQALHFFFEFQNRSFAVGSNTVWELTSLFDEVSPSAGDDAPVEHTTIDQYRTTGDAAGTVDIGGRIQFRDFIAKPGRSVRIKNFAVEHAIQHDGTNNAFDFTFGVDHSQRTQSSIVKTLTARDYDGAGTVEYDNGRYFIDRIIIDNASISPEAQVFRVRFDKPATSGYRNDGGHKIYRVYAMLEPTRNLRVDSTG